MNKYASLLALLGLSALALAAKAQEAPPPPPPGLYEQMQRMPVRQMTDSQREEARQRREAWRQMTPEDRFQLRRDIRDAGQTLYPRGRRRHPD